MTIHGAQISVSAGVEALQRQDAARKAREDRMRNALEILASCSPNRDVSPHGFFGFVRATAREGLGRDAVD